MRSAFSHMLRAWLASALAIKAERKTIPGAPAGLRLSEKRGPAMAQHNSRRNLQRQARRTLDGVIDSGRQTYERGRMLVRLLPVGPDDIVGAEPETTRRIVLKLARALRTERARGRAGHWTYDLNRHMGLLQALKAEQERLAAAARERLIRRIRN
jgi:hypothetical protein